MPCIHLDVSPEAYVDGQPATVHLCCFPDNEPARFVDAPRWLLRLVGSGLAITPEKDCAGCPAYKPRT
jgi:hypothetical protein